MSGKEKRFSECLVLDDSEKGVIIKGITDDTVAAKSGLQAGDKIVAATVHLDHLSKNDVQNILKVLEPYDNNMKVLTKKELSSSAGLGSLGLDLKGSAEMLNPPKNLLLDASAEAPGLSFDGLSGKLNVAQGLGDKISAPTLNGDLSNLSLSTPSADAGAKFKTPSLGLTTPDLNGDLDATLISPDVNVSTPQLNTPSASVNMKKPEITTGDLKYKPPKFTMPNFNLSQVKTPKAEMDIGDVDLPSVRGSLPAPNLSSPKVLDLKSPDLDLNGQKIDLNGPGVNLENPNANIEALSGKIKWPHQKRKCPKIKGQDADISADLSVPDISLSTPKINGDLNTPDADINLPKASIKGSDVDVHTGKINWPHAKWKKSNLQGPKADLDADTNLNTPDVNLSLPKVESGINVRDADVNFGKADLKGPDLDVKTPNIDAEAPSNKITWPHLKMKKSKVHGPKSDLDMAVDLNTPDLNLSSPKIEGEINVPNAELNFPKAECPDVDAPELDINAPSGKFNWPHLKWKKSRLHSPKADMDAHADLCAPEISVSKIDGEIGTPEANLNVPKLDADIKAPTANTEAPSGKLKFPTLKKPKFSGPKANVPDVDIDADVSTPDLKLSAPKIDGEISTPDAQLKVPKVNADIKTPGANIEAPSGKLKFPTLKKPKFSGPKANVPDVDIDADVSTPDLKLSAPKIDGDISTPDAQLKVSKVNADIKAPGANIEAPSGKLKFPTFKKPKLSGPKAKAPDVNVDADVSAPDLKLSSPKIDGEIKAPDFNLNLPKADIESPKLDINASDVEGPSGKVKLFHLKKPKFGTLKGPKADIGADVKAPGMDLKGPDMYLSTPDNNFSTPEIADGVEAPVIKGPYLDLKGPDLNVDSPDGKLKLPKMKLPKLKGTKVKGPELDVDLKVPDTDASLNLPKVNIDTPNLDVNADLKKPNLDLSCPVVDGRLPKADLTTPDVKLKAPDLSLSAPKTEGRIAAPDLDLGLPKADLKGPDVNVKTPDIDADVLSGKITIPAIKMPEIIFGGSKSQLPELKTSDVSLPIVELPKAGVKTPQLNISAPSIKGDLDTPNVDADLKTGIDHSALKTNTSLPGVNLSTPKIMGPDVDLNLPKADVKGPSVDLPKTDLKVPDVKLKAPDLSLFSPKIAGNLSAPNIDTKLPKAELEAPNMEINLPKVDLKGPDAQLKTPDLGFDSHPDVEVPSVHSSVKAGIEGSKFNIGTPAADAKISAPALDLTVPKLEGHNNGPELDVKGPNVDTNLEKSKLPHFKLQKFGFSGSKMKSSEVNTSANLDGSPDVKVKAPIVEAGISSSDVSVSTPEMKTSLNKPELNVTAEADTEVKFSPRSKLSWPFKSKGSQSVSNIAKVGGGIDSRTAVSDADAEVPVFKLHRLPRNSIDATGGIDDALGSSKPDTESKDYVVSKGIRLPIVNATLKAGEKIDIMERLNIAKKKAPALDISGSTEAGNSLVRGGTFQVEKPESVLGLMAPEILTLNEGDKLSLGLSNMLGLNIKGSDAD